MINTATSEQIREAITIDQIERIDAIIAALEAAFGGGGAVTIQPLPFANPIRVNERGIERTLCIIITADGRVTEWLTDDEIAALQES